MKETMQGSARGMILLGVVGLLGVGAWHVGNMLSPDAVALALGVIFGILATLPGALLALVAHLRRPPAPPYSQPPHVEVLPPPARQLPAPPTIVVTGGAYMRDPRAEEAQRRARLEARRARLQDAEDY